MVSLHQSKTHPAPPRNASKPLIQLVPRPPERQMHLGILALVVTWVLQLAALLFVSFLYLRAHEIDALAWLRGDAGLHLSSYDFIDGNRSAGSLVEILYWTGVAATLRWMNLTSVLWRRNTLHPSSILIEWLNDVIATPITAAVIVYAFRSPHVGFGQGQDLSLEKAEIGVFVVLGYLLGYFGQVPRLILNSVRERTLDSYLQKSENKGRKNKKRAGRPKSRKRQDDEPNSNG